jgi:hypothetical protein
LNALLVGADICMLLGAFALNQIVYNRSDQRSRLAATSSLIITAISPRKPARSSVFIARSLRDKQMLR